MISYWVTVEDSGGIARYRENRGRAVAHRMQTLLYEDIRRAVRFPAGAQIFSALDRLTACQRTVVAEIWDAHARATPDTPRLNDPRRVLLRFELLQALHEQGLNTYRAFRATDVKKLDRFPVFIRHMYDHDGPRTGLLQTRQVVARALRSLRLRGYRLQDLMIAEFCDTSDQEGLFRKYSAFKVGGQIIPCHLLTSHNWCVKWVRNEPTEERVRDELRFLLDNPHDEWLHRVFAVAGIDYGRVDYGVRDGVPQVWEINLNPTMGRGSGLHRWDDIPARVKDLREQTRQTFHRRLTEAFVALDTDSREPDIRATIGDALLDLLHKDASRKARRVRVRRRLSRLFQRPEVRVLVRLASRLFPRY